MKCLDLLARILKTSLNFLLSFLLFKSVRIRWKKLSSNISSKSINKFEVILLIWWFFYILYLMVFLYFVFVDFNYFVSNILWLKREASLFFIYLLSLFFMILVDVWIFWDWVFVYYIHLLIYYSFKAIVFLSFFY